MQTTENNRCPHADWKLKAPKVLLTKGEQEWFDWALAGATDALDDESWLADNEDALTVEGQIADMRYRLDEQAHNMIDEQEYSVMRGARRTLNSLIRKLESARYFEAATHKAE